MDKRFLKICTDVFDSFDSLCNEDAGYDFDKNSLRMLIESVVDENKRREFIFDSSNPDPNGREDQSFDLDEDLIMVSFGIGYLAGQLYDITDPKTLKSIEKLKRSLKKKACIPFFPMYPRQKNVSQT